MGSPQKDESSPGRLGNGIKLSKGTFVVVSCPGVPLRHVGRQESDLEEGQDGRQAGAAYGHRGGGQSAHRLVERE